MSENYHSDDELVTVAVIGGTDQEAQSIVERELAAAGIDCFIEGSVVYGIQVRSRDRVHAREVLRSSTDLKDHWVQFAVD